MGMTSWALLVVGGTLSACGGDGVALQVVLPGDGGVGGDASDDGGIGGASAGTNGGSGAGESGSGGVSATGGAPGSGGAGTGGANGAGGSGSGGMSAAGGAPGSGGAAGGECPTSPVVTADLHGVYSVGALDVWAVGVAGTILHYDGCWHVETSPTTAVLQAVWAAPGGVAWAVGAGGTTIRRDSGVWAIVAVPTIQGLSGVWGASATDVWAATSGDFTGGGADILHWNGAAWSVSFHRTAGAFASVSGTTANDVSVVGNGNSPNGDYASLILHWDGTAWTEGYTCNPDGSRLAAGGFVSYLTDVWSVAGGSVWAVGLCYSPTNAVGFVARAGVSQGIPAPGLAPLLQFRYLDAVWASADTNVWAASSGTGPLHGVAPTVLHFDGTSWTASSDPTTMGITDLGGSGAADVWAVGFAGKRLHFDGTAWTLTP